jgi:sugar lactone lactonase YvrE
MSDLEHLLPVQNEVGESPVWIPDQQALYWIDIEGNLIFRYRPASRDLERFEVDFPITALVRRTQSRWIAAAKNGLYFWDEQTGSSFLKDPEADVPNVRCNDGVIDRQGRFLVGTINEKDLESSDGSLYRYDADGSLHRLDTGLAVANGIGLSPDGETLYVTDMFHSRILAYDYDTESGTVSRRREFVVVPKAEGWPDGLIVDQEGFIWSAHWAGWKITRYDPTGKVERQIQLPVANPTCFAFGGDDLNELYITTAWYSLSDEDREKQPLAGDLFRIKTDVKGLVEPEFNG